MPNNKIIFQEQMRKAIRFRVATAQGNLKEVQQSCDEYTLNSIDGKGNSALHLACEHGQDEVLQFLFQQSKINLFLVNTDGKKPFDCINGSSTAKLCQEFLTVQKNLLQASVMFQKIQLQKNFALTLNIEPVEHELLTIEDLFQINDYVKQTVVYGAPNWEQARFPQQLASPASQWKKKMPTIFVLML